MFNKPAPSRKPRRKWLVPAIIAFILFLGNVAGDIVSSDLDLILKPYRLYVWVVFGIALVTAVAVAIREADYFNESPIPTDISTFSASKVRRACQTITSRLADELIRNRSIIPREEVREEFDNFLTSFSRYSILLGPSGVGKSVIMAVEARHLLEDGWAALLMRGRSFSLEYLAENIAQYGLEHTLVVPKWHQVVTEPWKEKIPTNLRGFVLLIDAIDEADPDDISRELLRLHDGIGRLPPDRFKVIVSCRDLAWERICKRIPFWQDREDSRQIELHSESFARPRQMEISSTLSQGHLIIEVTKFSDEELNRALLAIRATDLLPSKQFDEWADPHVATVRELLKHPRTFGLYSDLYTSGNISSTQDLTWSWLINQYRESALRDASAKCDVRPAAFQEWLLELADLSMRQKSRDFLLPANTVREALPGLGLESQDPAQSPYSALLEAGVLTETSAPGARRLIGFRDPDVGSYLLSFTLERIAEDKPVNQLQELFTEWLREANSYAPLLDALLAWIDRLADAPRSPLLQTLLDSILESHLFHHDLLFRLMRPTIIRTLFEAIRQKESHSFYAYRDAAKAVRPSQESMKEIHRHLNDPNPQVRELAIQLVGIHRNSQSIPKLIELLDDDEENVREAVFAALRRIGRPAVEPLLEIIQDTSQLTTRRRRCLGSLRAIGFLDMRVSTALHICLNDGQTSDAELLYHGLLAAAYLRDGSQTPHALAALSSQDWQVVLAAGKLLSESPDPCAFSALRETLNRWRSSEKKGIEESWVLRQLLVALLKTRKVEAEEFVLQVLQEGMRGSGKLSLVEAVWAADDLGLPVARSLILENLIDRLEKNLLDGLVWHSVNRLSATWQPDHLKTLVETTRRMSAQGTEIAQRIVDAIVQGIQENGSHPLSDHHTQAAALGILAKSQPSNFATEASRLLQHAGWSFDLEVCDALWVAGNSQAEEALLRKLEQPTSSDSSGWVERSRIVRALGTCGTEQGAKAILSYLYSEPTIGRYISEETICPLVWRNQLSPHQLIELVHNPRASAQGRTASLMALCILDAPHYKHLFQETINQTDDTTVLEYAVRALGFAQDATVAPNLRRLLHNTQHAFVAEQAAESLARLDAREAVRDIEQALVKFVETKQIHGFISTLAYFREPSSLTVLIDILKQKGPSSYGQEIREAISVFWPHPQAKKIALDLLETWRGKHVDLSEQCPPIRALAIHDPNFLLQRVIKLYDSGRLYRTAREELTRWILRLGQTATLDRMALLEVLKRLASDRYLPIREQLGQALGSIDPALCGQLYEKLSRSLDEWEHACAVYTLGFWDSDESKIQSARYAPASIIRHAADIALAMRHKHHAMHQLIEQFKSMDGLARLSSYLSIKEQADEQPFWVLRRTTPQHNLAHIFLRQLGDDIGNRLRDERRKRTDEEQKFLASAGRVQFD